MRSRIKKAAVVGVLTVTFVGGGIAFAGWLSTGIGDASSATAGTAKDLTVTAGTAATGLVPTVDKVVNATVTNPNPYGVKLKTVEVKSVTADATSTGAGCTTTTSAASAVPPAQATIDGYGTIAANNGTLNVPVTVKLGVDSHNACQGAVFTVNLEVSGISSN